MDQINYYQNVRIKLIVISKYGDRYGVLALNILKFQSNMSFRSFLSEIFQNDLIKGKRKIINKYYCLKISLPWSKKLTLLLKKKKKINIEKHKSNETSWRFSRGKKREKREMWRLMKIKPNTLFCGTVQKNWDYHKNDRKAKL